MTPILLLLICLGGDPDMCNQIPVDPPAVITKASCSAYAQQAFKLGSEKYAAKQKEEGSEGQQLTLNGFFCGYMAKLQDGKPS